MNQYQRKQKELDDHKQGDGWLKKATFAVALIVGYLVGNIIITLIGK